MTTRRFIVQCLGPNRLLEHASGLLNHFQSLGGTTRIVLGVRPPIRSQLTNESIAAWTKTLGALYCGSTKLNLTVTLAQSEENDTGEVIDLDKIPASNVVGSPQTPLSTDKLYSQVVLGGTFDRLHAGHKVLLSTALLRCTDKLTVGVSGPELLTKKTLPELISPINDRIAEVEAFLKETDNTIIHNVVEINDPFGPAITEPDLRCIVGSQETKRGCEAINEKRSAADMKCLDIHLISMVDAEERRDEEEEKVSSSTTRIRLLGKRLKPALQDWNRTSGPYLIGLTGGSASGKSSVAKRMDGLGWGVMDCDKLGHKAYVPGARAYTAIVKEWGDTIVNTDGTINRRQLGSLVFSDAKALKRLNEIVWPEIARMAMEGASELWKVWVCIVPTEVAVERIIDRDNRSKEEALKRVSSQLSNSERVKKANTVLCTLWNPSVTQRQVEEAVARLKTELTLT